MSETLNRRSFFATAASGLAWLMGANGEKPKRKYARSFLVNSECWQASAGIVRGWHATQAGEKEVNVYAHLDNGWVIEYTMAGNISDMVFPRIGDRMSAFIRKSEEQRNG